MLKIMLKKVICIICAVPLLAVLSLAPLRILAEEDGGYGQAGACAETGIVVGEAGDGSAVREEMGPGTRRPRRKRPGTAAQGKGKQWTAWRMAPGPERGRPKELTRFLAQGTRERARFRIRRMICM